MPPSAGQLADPRQAIRARRRRAFGLTALVLVLLAGVATLILAPVGPGAVRVLGMDLAWWVGGLVAYLIGLGLLSVSLPRPEGSAE